MPASRSVASLEQRRREEIEKLLDASAGFWFLRGLVHLRAAASTGPDQNSFGDIYGHAPPWVEEGPGQSLFEDMPHVGAAVGVDLESSWPKELDQRQVALRRLGAEDIRCRNDAVPGPRLPYVLAMIDELAELSAAESMDREEKARRQAALASIARMCRPRRALGFHVIASTQRPDADAVPGQVKANIPATAAFRVRSAVSRQIRLVEDSAAAAEAMLAPVAGAETACTERVTPCLLSHSVENTEAST
jgi:hypothetical protein